MSNLVKDQENGREASSCENIFCPMYGATRPLCALGGCVNWNHHFKNI